MGAIGTYGILSDHPTKFAAALAIAGFDPNDDPSALTRAEGVPLWMAHSINDPTVPYPKGHKPSPTRWTPRPPGSRAAYGPPTSTTEPPKREPAGSGDEFAATTATRC